MEIVKENEGGVEEWLVWIYSIDTSFVWRPNFFPHLFLVYVLVAICVYDLNGYLDASLASLRNVQDQKYCVCRTRVQGCGFVIARKNVSRDSTKRYQHTTKHAYTLTHEAHLYAIGIPFLVCVFCDLCVEIFLVRDFIITVQYDEYGHLIGDQKKVSDDTIE